MKYQNHYSLAFFLAILGTTTIITEIREFQNRTMKVENVKEEQTCLMKTLINEEEDEGYEEGYFSLYDCDQTSYEEHH